MKETFDLRHPAHFPAILSPDLWDLACQVLSIIVSSRVASSTYLFKSTFFFSSALNFLTSVCFPLRCSSQLSKPIDGAGHRNFHCNTIATVQITPSTASPSARTTRPHHHCIPLLGSKSVPVPLSILYTLTSQIFITKTYCL